MVYAAHPGNVGTIFVAGRCVERDGVLVDVDIAGVLDRAIKSRDELRAKGDIRIGGDWIPEATRPDEAA